MNLKNWFFGIRVYIAAAIVLVTMQAWLWSRVAYGGGNLSAIRLQEVYAWLAVGMLAAALFISPLLRLFPALPGKMILRDARRLIGIGAAWFALLHALISYAVQFHWPNPTGLAKLYQQSLGLGLLGLIILLLMALTSFDGAMRTLGVWWFRLHRLVYVAGLVALLHAFMVGTHSAQLGAFVTVGLIAAALLAFHITVMFRNPRPSNWQIITVTLLTVLVAAVLNYGLTQHLGYNILLKGHPGYRP